MIKDKKAITLIALIITIIVLLILAGVSIALVIGDNGIISKATKTSQDTKIATEKEKIKLAIGNAQIDTYNSDDGYLSTELLHDSLLENFENDFTLSGDGPWTLTTEDNTYYIEVSGELKSLDDILELLKQYFLNRSRSVWYDSENYTYVDLDPINDASRSIKYITTEDNKEYIEYLNRVFILTIENDVVKDIQIENKYAFVFLDSGPESVIKLEANKYENWYDWACDPNDNNDFNIEGQTQNEGDTLKKLIKRIYDNDGPDQYIEKTIRFSSSSIVSIFINNSYPYSWNSTEKPSSIIIPGCVYYLFGVYW